MRAVRHHVGVLAWSVLFAGEIAMLVLLVFNSGTGKPHQVPVLVVAPGVVAASLADQANELPGRPFAVKPMPDTKVDAARRQVAEGRTVAALVVDLSGTVDTLIVNDDRDEALNDAVETRVRQVEASRGRTLRVTASHPDAVVASGGTERACLLSALLGYALIVLISFRSGALAPTLRGGFRRTLLVGAVAVVSGAVLATTSLGVTDSRTAAAAGLIALHVLVVGLLTLALESLMGLIGLAAAAALFVVLNGSILTATDPYLLPVPWSWTARWSPTGATREALVTVAAFGGEGLLRPTLVVATWLLLAVATLLGSRRLRSLVLADRAGAGQAETPTHNWTVLLAVVPAGALLLAATVLVPQREPALGVLPSRASETGCVGTGELRTVRDLNRVAGRLRGNAAFQGGDVGADVLLQDGRRLWVFGDTLRGPDYEGQRFVRNSMLVVGPGCLSAVIPADHGAVIPDRPPSSSQAQDGEVGYWPMSIGRVERPGYDLVSIASQRVRTTGDGVFAFENLGTSIAVFVVPRGETPQLVAQRDIGPDEADPARPTWGAASAVVDDGGPWVYLYGSSRPVKAGVFGFALRVARVRPDDILDSRSWRFWDGTAWSPQSDRAAVLIPADGGVSQTLSVFESAGTWYALSKQDEFLGTNLTVWTGPSPTGPFTRQAPLAQLPSNTVSGLLRYMPLAHPDLLPRAGTMVVSYSQNNTDFGEIQKDPLLYRPRFLRVTLPSS